MERIENYSDMVEKRKKNFDIVFDVFYEKIYKLCEDFINIPIKNFITCFGLFKIEYYFDGILPEGKIKIDNYYTYILNLIKKIISEDLIIKFISKIRMITIFIHKILKHGSENLKHMLLESRFLNILFENIHLFEHEKINNMLFYDILNIYEYVYPVDEEKTGLVNYVTLLNKENSISALKYKKKHYDNIIEIFNNKLEELISLDDYQLNMLNRIKKFKDYKLIDSVITILYTYRKSINYSIKLTRQLYITIGCYEKNGIKNIIKNIDLLTVDKCLLLKYFKKTCVYKYIYYEEIFFSIIYSHNNEYNNSIITLINKNTKLKKKIYVDSIVLRIKLIINYFLHSAYIKRNTINLSKNFYYRGKFHFCFLSLKNYNNIYISLLSWSRNKNIDMGMGYYILSYINDQYVLFKPSWVAVKDCFLEDMKESDEIISTGSI
jgi:hypothetical protein